MDFKSKIRIDRYAIIMELLLHGIEKKFHYDGFEYNFERGFKSVFQISSLMKSLEKF